MGKGTGLGLSQVFGFAKQSSGDVDVQSDLGQGSTFTLYLPQSAPALDGPKVTPGAADPASKGDGVCVLVVEDNQAVGQFATEMLHDLGYGTVWAANASEALELLAKGEIAFRSHDGGFMLAIKLETGEDKPVHLLLPAKAAAGLAEQLMVADLQAASERAKR